MSNYDILTLQSETAKRHIDLRLKPNPKIVFIHGVGGSAQSRVRFFIGTL
jgi:hypothetical protein